MKTFVCVYKHGAMKFMQNTSRQPPARNADVKTMPQQSWTRKNTIVLIVVILIILGALTGHSHKQEVEAHPCTYNATLQCNQQKATQQEEHNTEQGSKEAAESLELAGH